MKDKILKYLAAGLKPAQVATLVGRSPGYISQLLSDEDFKVQLKAALADSAITVEDSLEARYEGLESSLMHAMHDQMANAELPAISRALDTVASIRDRRKAAKNPTLQQHGISVNIVQLALPAHAVPSQPVLQMNSQSEIVAIDNTPLAPLSAGGVRELFASLKASQQAAALESTKGDQNDSLSG